MRCNTCRTRIHDWFDSQEAEAMPPDVSEHVRDCSDCRSFIKKWNSVEIRLRSAVDQALVLSPDFSTTLRERLSREESGRRIRIPFPSFPAYQVRRVALASIAVLLIVLAARYAGNVRTYFAPSGPSIAATSRPDNRSDDPKPVIPPDLPFAKTQ